MTDINKQEATAKQTAPALKKAESAVPKAPTGTKMSTKGKALIGGVFAVLGVYLLWAVFGLSPKTATTSNPQESTSISSSELNNQSQQGQDLLTQLNNQAYGNSGATGAGTASQEGATSTTGGSLPSNMSGLATTSPNNGTSSPTGNNPFQGYSANSQANGATQDPAQQAMQNGMQSSLTPNGFDSGNSMGGNSSNNTAPAAPTVAPLPSANQAAAPSQDDQNMQGEKNSFLQNQNGGNDQLKIGVQNTASPYMVMAGAIIPATLITGIDSDLPGQIQALVSQNVYDSKTGNNILIPQGSKLLGTYDSQVAYGQSRVLIVWTRVIFPNDQYIDLEGMPGADLSGFAGLHDQVDNHYFRIYGSALLMSLFSAGMQLSQPNNNTSNGAPTNQQIIASAMGQQLGQTSTELIQKNINVQPTINIRQGDNFNVLVTRDIPFTGPYNEGSN
jgi:type IV secretory pathway VirB10-like protein